MTSAPYFIAVWPPMPCQRATWMSWSTSPLRSMTPAATSTVPWSITSASSSTAARPMTETSGPRKPSPLVLGILGAISQHAREVKPGVRFSLLSLGADGAEFVGWLYRDLQDPSNATYWYDRAMEWAQEANDTAMQGYVLLKKSQMAYDLRDAHRVVTFAEAAQGGRWRFPSRVRAEVTQQQAFGRVRLSEGCVFSGCFGHAVRPRSPMLAGS